MTSVAMPDICQTALAEAFDTNLFKALCDPVRISIVATLATRTNPASVTDIAECCQIDFSGVSRHLKILKESGVVEAKKEGRTVFYSLDVHQLSSVLRGTADALEYCQTMAS